MTKTFQASRGTRDVLGEELVIWQHIEAEARQLLDSHNFSEIRTPIFETTELFSRSIGEVTDIVGKEMYSFADKGGRSLTLRPEGTAGVVRAVVEHRLFNEPAPLRLWYWGPMFRYERPGAGRYRQLYQVGVEVFGLPDPAIDAELIRMAMLLFHRLGLPAVEVHLNNVGCSGCRPAYRNLLQAFLRRNSELLCSDCRERAERNPLRALDCKVPADQELLNRAPSITQHLCEECWRVSNAVRDYLLDSGIRFVHDPRLVRGLDYYTRIVYEFQVPEAESDAGKVICAGGRYDHLVAELGGPPTPAVGWALGMERLAQAVMAAGRWETRMQPAVYLAPLGPAAQRKMFQVAADLRAAGLRVECGWGRPKLAGQLKLAERWGAPLVVILGDDELARSEAILREMGARQQRAIALEAVTDAVLETCRRMKLEVSDDRKPPQSRVKPVPPP